MGTTSSVNPYQMGGNSRLEVDLREIRAENRWTVMKDLAGKAFVELAKSVKDVGMLFFSILAVLFVGWLVCDITLWVVGLAILPVALFPPLYNTILGVTGLAVGVSFTYFFGQKYCSRFFNQMKTHFNNSLHLFGEYNRVRQVKV